MQINKAVKFLGLRKDIKSIMTLMDVLILPSLWEGMPNVLLEAMALGRPVVATRMGGAGEDKGTERWVRWLKKRWRENSLWKLW